MVIYYLMALCCVAAWGSTFISSKVLLLHGLEPVEILLLRFGMAYVLLLPFYHKQLRLPSWKDEAEMLLLGLTGGSIYFMTENTAIHYTLTTNASLIVSLTPLYTMLLMYILHHRSMRIPGNMLLGSTLAVTGVFSVVMNGYILPEINPLGDFLALLSGISWSLYSILYYQVAKKWSALLITRKIFFWGFVTALPFALNSNHQLTHVLMNANEQVWGNLFFLGIIASLLCFFAWNVAVSKIGAIHAGNLLYFNPLVTLLVAHAVLNEPVTRMSIFGMLITILGVWIANRKTNQIQIKEGTSL